MSTVYIGGASIDEHGNAHGGQAGNQSGRELKKQSWYLHAKGWRVFRAKSGTVAAGIARCMKAAIANRKIGYDQYERNTLYNQAKPFGFDVSKVTTPCETDCSALVRVCCAYAGIMLSNFRTSDEASKLLNSGAFTEMTGDRYTKKSAYLMAGDILVTRTKGHTVVVLNDGSKAKEEGKGKREKGKGIARGDEGEAVVAMQQLLLAWDPASLPRYGADGDFGGETEAALEAFQKSAGLPVTGIYDDATKAALTAAVQKPSPLGEGGPHSGSEEVVSLPAAPSPRTVEITGGSLNVRSALGYDTRVLGVAHKGDRLPYQGETRQAEGRDWFLVEYKSGNGWVSSKYARIV